MVLQYYSLLARGHGGRLRLLISQGRQPAQSLREWLSQACNRDAALCFTRALMCSASWTYRRHAVLYKQWPWRLASVVDARVPHDYRMNVAKSFVDARTCDVDPLFSARLKKDITQYHQLFQPSVQIFLWAWCESIRVSIAKVEFTHGRNRLRASPEMSWPSFAAGYIHKEMKDLSMTCKQAYNQFNPSAPLPPPGPPPPFAALPNSASTGTEGSLRRKLRKKSAFMLFRDDCIKRGSGVNPVSASYWQQVEREWDSLDEDRRMQYEERAERSKDIAAAERVEQRQQRQHQLAVLIGGERTIKTLFAWASGRPILWAARWGPTTAFALFYLQCVLFFWP